MIDANERSLLLIQRLVKLYLEMFADLRKIM